MKNIAFFALVAIFSLTMSTFAVLMCSRSMYAGLADERYNVDTEAETTSSSITTLSPEESDAVADTEYYTVYLSGGSLSVINALGETVYEAAFNGESLGRHELERLSAGVRVRSIDDLISLFDDLGI